MKLVHIGKSIRPLKAYREHRHQYWELIYNTVGSGTTVVNGNVYPFEEGSILLLPPETLHFKAAHATFEDYFVLISDCQLPPVTYCFQTSPAENILPLLKILYSCYHDARHAVCANLLEAVMGLLAPRQEDMDKNAHQLRHLLTEGFADPEFRAVDAMAQLHLNEDYLRRCFKKELGVTPQAYLNQLRIENGKKLLEKADGTGMSVAEIAHLSGFYDPLYFSRVFRSITGCSPQEWKQKHSHAL